MKKMKEEEHFIISFNRLFKRKNVGDDLEFKPNLKNIKWI